jgi:hypothetical protein
MSATPVNFHIEKLVLTGPQYSRRDAATFRASLQRELKRLLQVHPIRPAHGSTYRALSAPPLPARTSRNPAAFGAQVAHSIYSTLGNAR